MLPIDKLKRLVVAYVTHSLGYADAMLQCSVCIAGQHTKNMEWMVGTRQIDSVVKHEMKMLPTSFQFGFLIYAHI